MNGEDRGDPSCGVCGDGLKTATAVACATCSSPHHPDCWIFNQGCSIFGCGGSEQVAFEARARALATQGLTITEATRPPLRLGPIFEGLSRKFWSRARFVKGTFAAGVGGTVCALIVSTAVGADPVRKDEVVLGMLAAGAVYGLLAPFFAPTIMRHPQRMAILSLTASVGTFLFLDAFRIRNFLATPFLLVVFLGSLLFASSVTEVLAGYRTRVGQALGAWGPVGRGVLAWLATAFGILMLAFAEDGRWRITEELVVICLSMGLMGGAVAVPAMEQGKKAFLAAIAPKLEAE